jgi:DNA polymerase-3 subunit gamma/tau
MSYLVLARKYRPQTFDEIVGQEHVTQTLKNAIATGRLHHAFLFTGARGVGKTTAARILAKCLSCDQAPTTTPCNVCEACREITASTSVDVQEIDAASNNGVDNIRELREAIRYAPVRGKKKVYILDEVHMLSGGAWNALLKTLEEPPPHAIFVFATTDPHKLPATILSRVQRYDFKLVPQRRIVAHIGKILDDEKIAHEPAALALVARESGGSIRDSLSLLDQVIASLGQAQLTEARTAEILGVADRTLLDKLAQAVLAKDAGAALALVDAAYVRGQDMAQLAHAFLGQLRDLVVAQAVTDASAMAALIDGSPTEIEALQALARTAAEGVPELLFERFAKVAEEVAKSPVPRDVIDVGLVTLTRVEPLEPLGNLLRKLEQLEARLEKGGASVPAGPSGGGSRPIAAPPVATPPQRAPQPAAPPPTAPQPVAPPPAATPQKRTAPENFTQLIEAVLDIDPLLSDLAQSRLLERDDVHLALGFDSDFAANRLRDRLPQLRAVLKKVTGEDLAIEIVIGPPDHVPATENLVEVEERRVDEDRERRRREALEHPARKALDARFGGTWKDPVLDNLEKDS